jgi:hypothetical protein
MGIRRGKIFSVLKASNVEKHRVMHVEIPCPIERNLQRLDSA